MTSILCRDPGSFRDPSGYVFIEGDSVWRTVNSSAVPNFRAVMESGALTFLIDRNLLIPTESQPVNEVMVQRFVGARGEIPELLLRHPRLDMISYPYEWTFSQLKDAAIAHLDLQVIAFDHGLVLSDATPYNMQFFNGHVSHIDVLSLRPYKEGEIWVGYNQFTRLFLLPLLLEAWRGIPFQSALRGQIEGIKLSDAIKLLPFSKRYFSLPGLLHVTLQERAGRGVESLRNSEEAKKIKLPANRFRALLVEMRTTVAHLKSARRIPTFWGNYAKVNTYSADMQATKISFVKKLVSQHNIRSLWDVGGNTGDYASAALHAGCDHVVVFDGDLDSLEAAYLRRLQGEKNLLPLYMDCTDPSPNLGWSQSERRGFQERANVDAVLGLAVVHHMAISRNIPLQAVVDWFVGLAPHGIIEFVPKSDPMVRQMLHNREDVFVDYDEKHFRNYLTKKTKIDAEHRFDENGRILFAYTRTG